MDLAPHIPEDGEHWAAVHARINGLQTGIVVLALALERAFGPAIRIDIMTGLRTAVRVARQSPPAHPVEVLQLEVLLDGVTGAANQE